MDKLLEYLFLLIEKIDWLLKPIKSTNDYEFDLTLHQYFGPFKSRIFDYINAVFRRFRHEEIEIYRRANCICTQTK